LPFLPRRKGKDLVVKIIAVRGIAAVQKVREGGKTLSSNTSRRSVFLPVKSAGGREHPHGQIKTVRRRRRYVGPTRAKERKGPSLHRAIKTIGQTG